MKSPCRFPFSQQEFWLVTLLVLFSVNPRGSFRSSLTTASRDSSGRWRRQQQQHRHLLPPRSPWTTTTTTRGGSARTLQPQNATTVTFSSNNASIYNAGELFAQDPSENRGPLKVLFLSSDTGGGHRASAESLAKQFLIHFPGSHYDLVDVWTLDGIKPYSTLVNSYKHLSAHPRQWRLAYHMSNAFPWEFLMDFHSTWTCERRIRQRIASYQPDVVVSVHPTMNHAPLISTRKISAKLGKKIPFFTVVTDLGSAHCTWFQRGVDKLYVASERLRRLAKRRGRTPDDKIVMSGLPIRHDFAEQADRLGDRMSASGKEYQKTMKAQLGLNSEKPMVLVMGGGEGVGSLEKIVEELHASFVRRGVNATICVVCGRNGKLSQSLAGKDWTSIDARERKRRLKFPRVPFLGGHKRSKRIQASLDRVTASELTKAKVSGNVEVVGLGFITNMADYMVAADVLVTKAGPGTIAEAAAVGLPIMLTSFLPGQEAGNVDYVLDNGFGDYCENPQLISEEVATWLQDPSLLEEMSRRAQDAGHPTAASEIVLDIGSTTHTWMALNGDA